MTAFRYIFIIFVLTGILLGIVFLRRCQNSSFYQFRQAQSRQNQLKQQLWQKQLKLELMLNPGAVEQATENSKIEN